MSKIPVCPFCGKTLSKSCSPIIGVWRGKSDKSDNSEIILKFCEDGQFFINGGFHTTERKVTPIATNGYFMTKADVKFKGNGIFSTSKDEKEIRILGDIKVNQQSNYKKYSVSGIFKHDGKYLDDYSHPIDFRDNFYVVVEDNTKKLYFKNNNGIIDFRAERYNGTCFVGGFGSFGKIG